MLARAITLVAGGVTHLVIVGGDEDAASNHQSGSERITHSDESSGTPSPTLGVGMADPGTVRARRVAS